MTTHKDLILRLYDRKVEINSLKVQIAGLEAKCAGLMRQIGDNNRYLVKIGCERGLPEPAIGIFITIHPREFQYYLLGRGPSDITRAARMYGQQAGGQVAQALIDFVEGNHSKVQ